MTVKVAIIYYSATGTTYQLALAVAESARQAGAEVRFRKVRELAPEEAIASNAAWAAHGQESQDVEEALNDDLEWANGVILGTPTRYGLPTAQLKEYLDATGNLWAKGALVNKICSSFTSTGTPHGGHETTIVNLNTTFYHWGAIVVGPGYADPIQFQSGNPYGTSFTSDNGALKPDEVTLARFQGKPVAELAAQFRTGKVNLHSDVLFNLHR